MNVGTKVMIADGLYRGRAGVVRGQRRGKVEVNLFSPDSARGLKVFLRKNQIRRTQNATADATK
jgi:hypothetical protein